MITISVMTISVMKKEYIDNNGNDNDEQQQRHINKVDSNDYQDDNSTNQYFCSYNCSYYCLSHNIYRILGK